MENLFLATRDLHHACESHTLGQAMVAGAISPQHWADWLAAMRQLHLVVDQDVPRHMVRDPLFSADLSVLPAPKISLAALEFAHHLAGRESRLGAAYVLHGAHHSGGRVLAPKMAKRGLPTAHTSYAQPENARAWIAEARGRTEFAEQARQTFAALLDVMNEIQSRK